MACEPSTSWVTALPMSCRNAPRLASAGSTPSSAAMRGGDVGGLDQVPEHVLAVRRPVLQPPQDLDHLGVDVGDADLGHGVLARPLDLLLDLARAPARTSPRSGPGGSGRPRPASRGSGGPISRRTGSKHDSTTASGVSSMIRLTPVVASKARMLRPSRPMIRPFMSSLGRANTETVDSAVCSEATRWMAIVTILRARSSPSSRARCSISRTCAIASRFASSTDLRDEMVSRASGEVMPAICSQLRPMLICRFGELLSHELELPVALLQLEGAPIRSSIPVCGDPSSDSRMRLSNREISSRRARTSSSASRRIVGGFLRASWMARTLVASASRSASETVLSGRAPRCSAHRTLPSSSGSRNPAAIPTARATIPTTTATIVPPNTRRTRRGRGTSEVPPSSRGWSA